MTTKTFAQILALGIISNVISSKLDSTITKSSHLVLGQIMRTSQSNLLTQQAVTSEFHDGEKKLTYVNHFSVNSMYTTFHFSPTQIIFKK